MAVRDFAVRIGQEEVGRIFNLKENLDFTELLLTYAPHYQQLGWVLLGMKSPGGTPLELDLNQPVELWSHQLSDLSGDQAKINLSVRTGKASNLLVLEVNRGEGALSLDQWGEWRADCVAEMGDCREQHYYALPAEGPSPPSFFQAPQVLIYGEGGLALLPPSLEPQAREPWRWLTPPWEAPPQPPKPAVWQFLKEYLPAGLMQPEVPSWPDIYAMIRTHGDMLKALLGPPVSQDRYYQDILHTALGLGLTDPALLLGLLWHAPLGEAHHNPDKWDYFQELVAQARSRYEGGAAVPGVPARLGDRAQPAQGATDPETAAPSNLPAPDILDMFSDSGLGDLGPQVQEAPSPSRFEKSVSGQFFQLLAGLGDKVIKESCRYEGRLTGLKSQVGELDHLASRWEQQLNNSSPPPPDQGQKPAETPGGFDWNAIIDQNNQKKQQIQELQMAVGDFLSQNPDLAGDRHKIQMVIFCLKNYISINPEYAGLPFREKLDRAGTLARGFFCMRRELC